MFSGHNNKTTNVFVFQLITVFLPQTLLFLLEDELNMILLRCLRWQTHHNSTIHSRADDASDTDVPDDSNGIRISLFLIALCGTAQCGWIHISHGNKTGQSDICS